MSDDTTNIAGYFNPKTYPISFQLSGMNINVQISPKRHLEVGGRRINDPVLQEFIKKTGMAVEYSRTPVPIVRLTAPAPIGTGAGFGGSSKAPSVEQQMAAKKVPPSKLAPAEGTKVQVARRPVAELVTKEFAIGPANAVQGMSMAEARKRGLVETVRTREVEGIPDKEGAPPENPPEIRYPMDSKLRRFLTGKHQQLQSSAASHVQTPVPEPTPGAPEAEHQPIEEAELPAVDVAGLTAQIMNQMNAPATPDAGTPAPTATAGAAEPTVHADTAPAAPTPEDAEAAKKPFVCSVDGKRFQYRSYLVRHIKRNWPERLDELLAPYPAKP